MRHQLLVVERSPNEPTLTSIRPNNRQIAAVIHGIPRLAGIGRNERYAQGIGQLLGILDRPRHPDEILVEITQVLLQLVRRVAVRVNAHQHHLQPVDGLLGQLALHLAQLGQGRRADVGAVGVTEEKQRPFALQVIQLHRLAVLVGHGHIGHGTALRQQDDAGIDQLGGVGLVAAIEHLVDGQAQDQRDQGNEDEDGFLGSGHRFSNR